MVTIILRKFPGLRLHLFRYSPFIRVCRGGVCICDINELLKK